MFPTLFKPTKTGKMHQWNISVENATITRSDGEVNGKQTESKREIAGNTVRTPEEQAKQEAEKMWIKQVDKGYKPDPKDINGSKIYDFIIQQKSHNGGMNRGVKMFGETAIKTDTTGGEKNMTIQHHPMLSQKYTERADKIEFPVYVQGKCDGMRCLTYLDGDRVVLESRNGKDFVHLSHIRESLKKILKTGIVLDGELYVHHLYKDESGSPTNLVTTKPFSNVGRFQFLSEACKVSRTKPHEFEQFVQYWVFDLWDLEATNEERNKKLKKILGGGDSTIIMLPTHVADSHEDIEKHFQIYLDLGYEGCMIRQIQATYVSRKGYHAPVLLKYKPENDEEWIILDAKECDGNQKGCVIWKCGLNGKEVMAKQIGDVEMSRSLFSEFSKNPKEFIGKHINIRYNELTSDGVPRFPRSTWIVEDKF